MKTLLILMVAGSSALGQTPAPELWNRPTEIERMGATFKQPENEKSAMEKERARVAEGFARQREATNAVLKAKADSREKIQSLQQNPNNYRVVTGQVYNVELSHLWKRIPGWRESLKTVDQVNGLMVFKQGKQLLAVTNYTGPVALGHTNQFKGFDALQIGETSYKGKQLPLFDCGTLPDLAVKK